MRAHTHTHTHTRVRAHLNLTLTPRILPGEGGGVGGIFMCISYIVKQVMSPGTSTFGSNLRLKLTESRCLRTAFDSLCLKYQNDRVTVMSSERDLILDSDKGIYRTTQLA